MSRQSYKKSRNERPTYGHTTSHYSTEMRNEGSVDSTGSAQSLSKSLLSETAQAYQQPDPYAQTFALNPLQQLVRKTQVDTSIDDTFKLHAKHGVHLRSAASQALRAQGRSHLEAYQSQSVVQQAYKDM